MADYSTLLRDHVTLNCRSIDRIFMQAYVPKLQSVGQVCIFLRWQRGSRFPRRPPLARMDRKHIRTWNGIVNRPLSITSIFICGMPSGVDVFGRPMPMRWTPKRQSGLVMR